MRSSDGSDEFAEGLVLGHASTCGDDSSLGFGHLLERGVAWLVVPAGWLTSLTPGQQRGLPRALRYRLVEQVF